MSETDSAPTWRKIDEHNKRLTELEIESRIAADRIASAEKAMERFAKESADNRATILASINSLQASVNTLAREQHMRMGASAATKWAVPIVLTMLTLLTAWDILGPSSL